MPAKLKPRRLPEQPLDQIEVAAWLCQSRRHVRNLEVDGLPRLTGGDAPLYEWPKVFAWYLAHREGQIRAQFDKLARIGDEPDT
jgi:hypothetical protein